MARIRTIKPDFWFNEDVAAWSRDTRLVFIGLLTYCQDHGVGSANVRRLASQILPMDDPGEAEEVIERALAECSATGQIVVYNVDKLRLYWVRNFDKQQRVDRPGKCDLPLPTLAQLHDREPAGQPAFDEDSTNVRRTLSSVVERSGVERSGVEEKHSPTADAAGPPPTASAPRTQTAVAVQPPLMNLPGIDSTPAEVTGSKSRRKTPTDPAGFREFWDACPRKVGKGAARNAFTKALARGISPVQLHDRMVKMSEFWCRTSTEERFMPHPATWLNQARYEDPTPAVPQPKLTPKDQKVADILAMGVRMQAEADARIAVGERKALEW